MKFSFFENFIKKHFSHNSILRSKPTLDTVLTVTVVVLVGTTSTVSKLSRKNIPIMIVNVKSLTMRIIDSSSLSSNSLPELCSLLISDLDRVNYFTNSLGGRVVEEVKLKI